MEHEIGRDVTVSDYCAGLYGVHSKASAEVGMVRLSKYEIKALYNLVFPPEEPEVEEVKERCIDCGYYPDVADIIFGGRVARDGHLICAQPGFVCGEFKPK